MSASYLALSLLLHKKWVTSQGTGHKKETDEAFLHMSCILHCCTFFLGNLYQSAQVSTLLQSTFVVKASHSLLSLGPNCREGVVCDDVWVWPVSLPFQHPDPRMMQINLTGFLNGKNARDFMGELWSLLLSAQETVGGIPAEILEEKKAEIRRRQVSSALRFSYFKSCEHCSKKKILYAKSCSHLFMA